MSTLAFIIGALSGGIGAAAALWKRTQLEMLENIRLQQERNQAYGKGYQDGFVASHQVKRELSKICGFEVTPAPLPDGVIAIMMDHNPVTRPLLKVTT